MSNLAAVWTPPPRMPLAPRSRFSYSVKNNAAVHHSQVQYGQGMHTPAGLAMGIPPITVVCNSNSPSTSGEPELGSLSVARLPVQLRQVARTGRRAGRRFRGLALRSASGNVHDRQCPKLSLRSRHKDAVEDDYCGMRNRPSGHDAACPGEWTRHRF